jgi:hypothetical protein
MKFLNIHYVVFEFYREYRWNDLIRNSLVFEGA